MRLATLQQRLLVTRSAPRLRKDSARLDGGRIPLPQTEHSLGRTAATPLNSSQVPGDSEAASTTAVPCNASDASESAQISSSNPQRAIISDLPARPEQPAGVDAASTSSASTSLDQEGDTIPLDQKGYTTPLFCLFEERIQKEASTGQASQPSPPKRSPDGLVEKRNIPLLVLFTLLQLAQLAVVLGALIIFPAAVVPGGLESLRPWLLFFAYMLFFSVGSVYRLVAFGGLAPKASDRQRQSLLSRVALLCFIIFVPLFHWLTVTRFLIYRKVFLLCGYDILGFGGIFIATALHTWAVLSLGKAYDRVVVPDQLVTWGPYKHVQHPIYTSYIILFASFALALHSLTLSVLVTAVCLLYYTFRTGLESKVLLDAFGVEYVDFARTRKRFSPFLY